MNNKGMFYTNVNDYETKEDMMNDFIALRMFDIAKDKEIERLSNIIKEAIEYIRQLEFESEELYDISEIARLELLDILKGSDKE